MDSLHLSVNNINKNKENNTGIKSKSSIDGNLKKRLERNGTHFKVLTICIMLSFSVEAMASNMLGPTLLHMGYLLKSDVITMSFAFTFEYSGFLIGCLLCGIVYPCFNEEIQFCVGNVVSCVFTIASAWAPNVYIFFAAKFTQTLATGYNNAISHSTILKLWSAKNLQAVIYQILLASNPLGAVIGPLIVSPFLVELPKDDNFTVAFLGKRNNFSFNGTDSNNSTDISTDFVYSEIGMVRYSYVINGALFLTMSLIFGLIFICSKLSLKRHDSQTARKSSQLQHSKFVLIICICVISFATSYVVIMSWVSPFVVKHLGWNSNHASYLASSFWLGMLTGRVFGIFLLLKIVPRSLLGFHLVTTVLAVVFTYIANFSLPKLLWFCIPVVGFAVSTTFGVMMLWLSEHVTPSSCVTSAILCCNAVGYMTAGATTGFLFQTYSPVWVIHLSFIASLVQLAGFCMANLTLAYKCNKSGSGIDKELNGPEALKS